jgi:hypothetical protein
MREWLWGELKAVLRLMKKFSHGLSHLLRRKSKRRGEGSRKTTSELPAALNLQPGEKVRIKNVEEINKTLDAEGKFQGCLFTREMWDFCGEEFVVFKRVNMFLNETNNRIQKISHTVLLEGAYCTGQRAFGEKCDRSCFLFWKEAWLERVNLQ